MANKYNHIHKLINLWDAFEQSNLSPDIVNFGKWLVNNKDQLTDVTYINNKQNTDSTPKREPENEPDTKQQFFSLISRLSRLQDFYVKRFFEGIPLNNLLEFNFLSYINKNTSLRKKEIINYHLVEYTTGIDIIKRLIKLNLVSESKDLLDKRSKRLKITTEGKRILMQALISMNKIGYVFLEIQNTNNLVQCLEVLSGIEEYHRNIFAKNNMNTSYEILHSIYPSEEL